MLPNLAPTLPTSKAVRSVLIVEDEILIAENVRRNLQKLGYEIAGIMMTGEEAIAHCEDNKPDLILMDIKLAGNLDGIQTAEALLKKFKVPIVFASAYSDDATLKRVMRLGPYGYIVKPYQIKDLKTAMELAFFRFTQDNAQREEDANYQELLGLINESLIVTNLLGEVVYLNRHAEAELSISLDEAYGKPLDKVCRLVLPGSQGLMALLQRVIDTGALQGLPDGAYLELPHAQQLPIAGQFVPYRQNDDKHSVVGTLLQLRVAMSMESVEQKRHFERLLSLQDEGRKHLANDLHEGLGQLLSAAAMNLENVKSGDPDQSTTLEAGKRLISDAVKKIRSLTHTVMPNTLKDFGLEAGLRSFADSHFCEACNLTLIGSQAIKRCDSATEFSTFKVLTDFMLYIKERSSDINLALSQVAEKCIKAEFNYPVAEPLITSLESLRDKPELEEAITRLELLNGTLHTDWEDGVEYLTFRFGKEA